MNRNAIPVCVFLITFSGLNAQSVENKQAFEVASIKPADPSAGGSSSWNTHPGRLVASNQTLKSYVVIAYDLKERQVSGGPKWVDSERFDIVAKMPDADKPPHGQEIDVQIRAALQALLADRFKLQVHREARTATGYALVVSKRGPKLRDAAPDERNSNNWTRGKLTSTNVSMPKLADVLSRMVGSPVADMTGLKGKYDLTLEWTPDEGQQTATSEKEAGPSLFTAVQEQLGLKLESRKTEEQVVVIDRAEKPTEN
jgi:uncharacterized protein (TIGR03435 family)